MSNRKSRFAAACLLAAMALWPLAAQAADSEIETIGNHTVYWSEDWEDGMGVWSASNGVWEVGAPSYGTSECTGAQCAATNLDGAYPQGTWSRLESEVINLPEAPADDVLWLGFQHYFSNSTHYGTDFCSVHLWTEATGWTEISPRFYRNSVVWSYFYLDITEFAGQEVRIGLLFDDQADNSSSGEGPGWYVDEIRIFDGAFPEPLQINRFDKTRDMDWDGWYPDQGVWELGEPTYGVPDCYSRYRCFGTNLDGAYPYGVNSRLISPYMTLNPSPQDGRLWFSYRQYVNLSSHYGIDLATLQINDGSGWTTLDSFNWQDNLDGEWIERTFDISEYAGQRVRLGFVIDDNPQNSSSGEGAGWYIDDLQFSEGDLYCGNPERFENYAPNWQTTSGLWEVGEPEHGPESAYSGTRCWGTDLDGNYQYGARDRLITPPITLDNTTGLYLKFMHWYSFSTHYGTDYGKVSIRELGGDWVDLSSEFTNNSGGWTQFTHLLDAYAGLTVQFGFLMTDRHDNSSSGEGAGWYIDDFEIVGMEQREAPAPPLLLNVSISSGPAELQFPHASSNVAKVVVYGSSNENFKPSLGTRLIELPAGTMTWTDTARPGWRATWYRVSVVDELGNESVPIPASSTSPVDDHEPVPAAARFDFHGAAPNPFNPTTYILFDLPVETMVDVEIFDLRGHRVELLDHRVMGPGPQKVMFAPRDLASGTYFARVSAGGVSQTKKLLLLK